MPSTKNRKFIDNRLERKVAAGGDNDKFESHTILLRLENGKRYAHTATCSYQLSMASLQPDDRKMPNCACNQINKGKQQSKNEDRVVVILEHNLKEYIICMLDSKKLNQCKLNLIIQPGEQVAYRTIGKIPVLLTGVSSEAH